MFRPEQQPVGHSHDGEAEDNQRIPFLVMPGPCTLLHDRDQEQQCGGDGETYGCGFNRRYRGDDNADGEPGTAPDQAQGCVSENVLPLRGHEREV